MRGPERKGGRSQRQIWRPGNMLYPVPAVMVSAADGNGGSNIITVAWAGTVCSDPVMLSISVRPERYSYDMIRTSGEFVVNLTTRSLARAADYCGVRSGWEAITCFWLRWWRWMWTRPIWMRREPCIWNGRI